LSVWPLPTRGLVTIGVESLGIVWLTTAHRLFGFLALILEVFNMFIFSSFFRGTRTGLFARALGLALFGLCSPLALAANRDREGDAIRVVKIQEKTGSWLDRLIDTNYCRQVDEHTFEDYVSHGRYVVRTFRSWNCSSQVARHPEVWAFPIRDDIEVSSIDGVPNWTGLQVPLLLVDLLIPDEAWSSARTVGFSRGANGGTIAQVPVTDLEPFTIARVTTTEGQGARVVRAYLPLGSQGVADGCDVRRAMFKPFLGFVLPDGTSERVWDDARGAGLWTDYLVTNFLWRNGPLCLSTPDGLFDRYNELVASFN
jgi:hypothetical protein